MLLRKDLLLPFVLVAVIIYSVTAYNSHGFYHADEHYQIIEFAGLKLGTHTSDDLAWEFNAQIRSALQPAVGFLVLKSLTFLKVTDPYTQSFILRLLSGLLAIAVISYFIRKTSYLIHSKGQKVAYYALSFFLWFIPFISVRFSSETWAGLSLLLALACFLNEDEKRFKWFLIGLLLGLSFLFRFQMAFAILGFGIWLLVIQREKLKNVLLLSAGFLTIWALGICIDSWFYGELVLTPLNYYTENIVQGVASSYGVSPWYYYFQKLVFYPTIFIGAPLLLSIGFLLTFRPKNLFIWVVVFFVLGHTLVDHKEERFLFPIVYLFPLILMQAGQILWTWIRFKWLKMILAICFVLTFLTVNSMGLIVMGQKAAGIGRQAISKYIHDRFGDQKVNLIYCSWASPYNPWHYYEMKFYKESNLTEQRIGDICDYNESLIVPDAVNLLVLRKYEITQKECYNQLQNNHFLLETQSIPPWIENLNKEVNLFEQIDILELYRYQLPNP